MTKAVPIFAALAVALGATSALAQTNGGLPADPNANENRQPAPSTANPADPAAGSNAEDRIPTAPPPEAMEGAGSSGSEGMGSGEAGVDAPAGIPADPFTNENQQPGPSVGNPTDPAAGSDPAARVPTESEAQ